MSGPRRAETWSSFWGELLLLRSHAGNPERWPGRERKADWLISHLALPSGAAVVDLGCGDGVLDICLARRGYRVLALDRIEPVIGAARREAAGLGVAVDFQAADLRDYDLGRDRFDAAIMLDTLGLLGRAAEVSLLSRASDALTRDGRLLLDWPVASGDAAWERQFPDGLLRVHARFDAATCCQHIDVTFEQPDGTLIELHDPYAPPDHAGIRRYLYPEQEARDLLTEAGFTSEPAPHYSSHSDYRSLVARRA